MLGLGLPANVECVTVFHDAFWRSLLAIDLFDKGNVEMP